MWQAARTGRRESIGSSRRRPIRRHSSNWTLLGLAAFAVGILSSTCVAESISPFDESFPTSPWDVIETVSDDDQEETEDRQVEPLIEELFLGTIVYPQEAGELQLTGGYFHGDEGPRDFSLLWEVEYGITDQLQIGAETATQFARGDVFEDVQQCSVEVYYNFYSDRRTGRAYGLGFEFGLPIDTAADEPRACVYEPFFVAYQDYRAFALNPSAALEIADPVAGREETDVAGDITLAAFRRVDRVATILEANVAFDSEESLVRLAPGLYWRPFDVPLDLAVSLPIGLTDEAPNLGVFVLAILEFEATARSKR